MRKHNNSCLSASDSQEDRSELNQPDDHPLDPDTQLVTNGQAFQQGSERSEQATIKELNEDHTLTEYLTKPDSPSPLPCLWMEGAYSIDDFKLWKTATRTESTIPSSVYTLAGLPNTDQQTGTCENSRSTGEERYYPVSNEQACGSCSKKKSPNRCFAKVNIEAGILETCAGCKTSKLRCSHRFYKVSAFRSEEKF